MVVVPARGEVLFRLLGSEEIKERDFLNNVAKGRPPLGSEPFVARLGLSMYEHPDQAVLKARRYPVALAAVTLVAGSGLMLAKTYGVGHYTVWGDPDVLLDHAQLAGHIPR